MATTSATAFQWLERARGFCSIWMPFAPPAVNDVLQAITAELLVWGRDVHRYVRAGNRAFDGRLDLLLQGIGRGATDEDVEEDFGVDEPTSLTVYSPYSESLRLIRT